MYLIGNGFDCHKIVESKKGDPINYLAFGGIKIYDNNKRFKAHSDGDIVIHAIVDSLISPIFNVDIGQLFPDNDINNKNLSSISILKNVINLLNGSLLKEKDFFKLFKKDILSNFSNKFNIDFNNISKSTISINNIDITVICDIIKINKIKDKVIKKLGEVIPDTTMSIKGKTTEGAFDPKYCYVWVNSLIEVNDLNK